MLDGEAEHVAVWSKLCRVARSMLRRQEPPSSPTIGERYQATEQAEAQRRLLDQAQRLRHCEHPAHGTRGDG